MQVEDTVAPVLDGAEGDVLIVASEELVREVLSAPREAVALVEDRVAVDDDILAEGHPGGVVGRGVEEIDGVAWLYRVARERVNPPSEDEAVVLVIASRYHYRGVGAPLNGIHPSVAEVGGEVNLEPLLHGEVQYGHGIAAIHAGSGIGVGYLGDVAREVAEVGVAVYPYDAVACRQRVDAIGGAV